MGQVATTIRMDSDLKSKFDKMCEEFGMSINTAVNIFAKAVVRSRSIPFKIEAADSTISSCQTAFYTLREQAKDSQMTLNEINEEIIEYRKSKK